MTVLLDPTATPAKQTISFVPRPDALHGKRIALIENTKFNSDRLLQKIADILIAEYGAAEARMWRKFTSSVPAHQVILDEVRSTSDVAIAGIGD